MRKFVVLLLTFLLISIGNKGLAYENNEKPENPILITFIYLNGSNDLSYENRLEFKELFKKDVEKLHPKMIEGFENDELSQKLLLQNGKFKINPEPIVFYWGDKTLNEIKHIDSGLNSAKKYTPRIAQKVRSIFAHCLHDAIWVQKYQNMDPIIDELQKVVKTETDKGNKVVLLGYSAGSFITYQYFLHKFTSIVPSELVSKGKNQEVIDVINSTPMQSTCLDALLDLNLVNLDVTGKFKPNSDIENFKEKYTQLDEKTNLACFKNHEVKGVINFASPLILFYSNISDASTSINFLSQLMVKNIVENDLFFITVNYRNDPLGFPNSENITMKKLKNSNSILAKYYKSGNGFIYNKSDIYVPRTFITAHMAYWSTPKRFVKGIINAYNDGYKNFYDKQN